MKSYMRIGMQKIELKRSHECRPDDTPLVFFSKFSALSFLHILLGDPINMMTMRARLSVDGAYSLRVGRLGNHEVLNLLALDVISGRYSLLIKSEQGWRAHSSGSTPAADRRSAAPENRLPTTQRGQTVKEQPTGWVEFQVVDHETGKPLEGVILKVRIPSEGMKRLSTDANGDARIESLDAGTCDIDEIIDLEALEVVRVSSSIN